MLTSIRVVPIEVAVNVTGSLERTRNKQIEHDQMGAGEREGDGLLIFLAQT